MSLNPKTCHVVHIPIQPEKCHKFRRLKCGPLRQVSVITIVEKRLGAKVDSKCVIQLCDLCSNDEQNSIIRYMAIRQVLALLTCLSSYEQLKIGEHLWFSFPQSLRIYWQHLVQNKKNNYMSYVRTQLHWRRYPTFNAMIDWGTGHGSSLLCWCFLLLRFFSHFAIATAVMNDLQTLWSIVE